MLRERVKNIPELILSRYCSFYTQTHQHVCDNHPRHESRNSPTREHSQLTDTVQLESEGGQVVRGTREEL
jgi:hypothetical protein